MNYALCPKQAFPLVALLLGTEARQTAFLEVCTISCLPHCYGLNLKCPSQDHVLDI